MKFKRIITTVLTLCFVAAGLAGVAQATQDIGSFNRTFSVGGNHVYSTLRHRYGANNTPKSKAVINVSYIVEETNISSMPGDSQDGMLIVGIPLNWQVRYDGDAVTSFGAVYGTRRQTRSYNIERGNGLHYTLELQNNNSFIITATGTWAPDDQ